MSSNVYPWQEILSRRWETSLHVIERSGIDVEWTDAILEAIETLGESPGLVALPNFHWCDGSAIDLPTVAIHCHQVGGRGCVALAGALVHPPPPRLTLQLSLPCWAPWLQLGVPIVLDLTQSAGVVPLEMSVIQPLAVVASVHKWLLGAYGTALLYLRSDVHDAWVPLEAHERFR